MNSKFLSLISRFLLFISSTYFYKILVYAGKCILPKGERVFIDNNGLKKGFDISKALENCILHNIAEPLVISKFLSVTQMGDTVIDVGAFIGTYTLLAARQVGIEGHVISVEPNTQSYARLLRNIELNRFTNVQAINCAAGDESTVKNFRVNSFLSHIDSSRLSDTVVRVETLDTIISDNGIPSVRLVKIDTEGYEYHVLKGLATSFKKHMVENLLIEVHPTLMANYQSSIHHIYGILGKNGFKWDEFRETRHRMKGTFYIFARLCAD